MDQVISATVVGHSHIQIFRFVAKWLWMSVRNSYENSGKRGKTGKGRRKLAQGEIAGSQKSVEADSLD
jgi:hypothetical protein